MAANACIGLGANVGSREAFLRAALDFLDGTDGIRVVTLSRIYETDPVGPPQPRYFNAACSIQTSLDPRALLTALQSIEARLGRTRQTARWGPRTIDLDLLTFEDRLVLDEGLVVPHPSLHERDFALAPLCDLAAEGRHAALKVSFAELLAAVGGRPARSWPFGREPRLEETPSDPRHCRVLASDFADLAAACARVVLRRAGAPSHALDAVGELVFIEGRDSDETLLRLLVEVLDRCAERATCQSVLIQQARTTRFEALLLRGAGKGTARGVRVRATKVHADDRTQRLDPWLADVALD